MTNKYDITLSEQEKEKLIASVKAINDFCIDLVKDFDTSIELESNWSYRDSVWGLEERSISIKKDNNSVKVRGQCGGLQIFFDFEKDGDYPLTRYYLSLIDNWKSIKEGLIEQLETAKSSKQLIQGFVV